MAGIGGDGTPLPGGDNRLLIDVITAQMQNNSKLEESIAWWRFFFKVWCCSEAWLNPLPQWASIHSNKKMVLEGMQMLHHPSKNLLANKEGPSHLDD